MTKLVYFVGLTFIFAFGCMEPDPVKTLADPTIQQDTVSNEQPMVSIDYLALGDSYTIGESVDTDLRWPVQLSQGLNAEGIQVNSPRIIARTGWTTQELASAIDKAELEASYDLVSLLIGVNNQYRGHPISEYPGEFEGLLKTSIALAGGNVNRVFVLSIPDYGVTPFGQSRDPQTIADELDMYNNNAREICERYRVIFYDITPISRLAINKPEYVAKDGLHPSGEMYAAWVELILGEVKESLIK